MGPPRKIAQKGVQESWGDSAEPPARQERGTGRQGRSRQKLRVFTTAMTREKWRRVTLTNFVVPILRCPKSLRARVCPYLVSRYHDIAVLFSYQHNCLLPPECP
eukprot:2364357-Rhodomonas_salina.4